MIDTALDYNEEVLKDFFKFQINVRQHTKWLFIGCGLVVAAVGFVMWLIVDLLAVGIACWIIGLAIVVNYPFQVNRAVKKQNYKAFLKLDQRVKIDSSLITQYKDSKKVEYEWNAILDVVETKKYFYLYNSKYGALIITKSLLKDNEANELRGIIKTNNKKIKRPLFH